VLTHTVRAFDGSGMTGASVCRSQSDATRNFGTSLWHPPKLHALPSPQTVDSAAGIYLISVRRRKQNSRKARTLPDVYRFSRNCRSETERKHTTATWKLERIRSPGLAESRILYRKDSASAEGYSPGKAKISARCIDAVRLPHPRHWEILAKLVNVGNLQ
jgi:hypothetical protein